MIARSWKISRPRLTWPNVVPDSPRSPSSFKTMAVDDSETRNPVNSAGRQPTPNGSSTAIVATLASSTCNPPPPKISVVMRPSFSRLNSMPMVKSSRMTPNSAAAFTSAGSETTPSALGPMTTPASRKPTMGTRPRR